MQKQKRKEIVYYQTTSQRVEKMSSVKQTKNIFLFSLCSRLNGIEDKRRKALAL